MKKTILVTTFLLAGLLANAQEEKEAAAGATLIFAEKTFEFGEIQQGDKVEHTFSFENTGNQPLIISNVRTTCGCTVPKWPREPIAPGESGEIFVVFNSAGKSGAQSKVITVLSNAADNGTKVLLKGTVKIPEQKAGGDR